MRRGEEKEDKRGGRREMMKREKNRARNQKKDRDLDRKRKKERLVLGTELGPLNHVLNGREGGVSVGVLPGRVARSRQHTCRNGAIEHSQ